MKSLKTKFISLAFVLAFMMTLFGAPAMAVKWENNQVKIINNQGVFEMTPEATLKPAETGKTQANETLPAAYDLRDVNGKNYVGPVKFQNPWGCCWAFAAIGASESNALKKGAPSDTAYSERALSWYSYQNQGSQTTPESLYEGVTLTSPDHPEFNYSLPFNSGGDIYTPISQLSSWNGASTEQQAPYQNDEGIMVESPVPGAPMYSTEGTWSLPYKDIYNDAFRLQNATVLETNRLNGVEDYTSQAKELLMEKGALFMMFYMCQSPPYLNTSTWSQYLPTQTDPDHGVTVVGWDDNYPASNFSEEAQPPADGAWIVKNSYSSKWGYDGFFYLSYYDQSITNFVGYDMESEEVGYTYDNNYEYDFIGNKVGTTSSAQQMIGIGAMNTGEIGPTDLKAGNIFTAESDEVLQAVSAFTFWPVTTQVVTSVYLLNPDPANPEDGELALQQTDTLTEAGFHTLELSTPIVLEEGQSFSVVQSVLYEDVSFPEIPGDPTGDMVTLPVEFGTTKPMVSLGDDPNYEMKIQIARNLKAVPVPDMSYVYGMNAFMSDDPGSVTPQWEVTSSQNVQENYLVPLSNTDGSLIQANMGNAMIKAYTTDIGEGPSTPEIPATGISVNNGAQDIYLATTGANAQTSVSLTATLIPANSTDPIVWTVGSSSVASLSSTSGNTVTLTGVSEGRTTVDVIAGSASTTLNVIVSNQKVVANNIEVVPISPDYFSIVVNGVMLNPALNAANETIQKVSIFCWSAVNENGVQTDINAKVAEPIAGTNDWQWQGFPVNDNAVNNYFYRADNIVYNIYASTSSGSDGNLVGAGKFSWMNSQTAGSHLMGYIGYEQNKGFTHPTVFDGFTVGSPGSGLNLEGFRISSNIPGIQINSQAYIQNIGEDEVVQDGGYVGTMHQNLGLEGVALVLEGPGADNYELNYRVYQKGIGWTNWVESGQFAGSQGQNIQIEALQVQVTPIS